MPLTLTRGFCYGEALLAYVRLPFVADAARHPDAT